MSTHRPRRQFGQNFLRDGNVIRKIIAHINPAPGDHFVEIGPGQGALTAPLLARCQRLDAVEIDRDLAAALPAVIHHDGLQVHCTDALKFDFAALLPAAGAGAALLRLAGNLPYNISTPLLFHLLAASHVFADLHVMLQKEVGDRMAAAPGSKVYGRLTVALAARCRVERLFTIGPGSFRPAPQVDSVFLRLIPHRDNPLGIHSFARYDELTTRAFGQRRKRLANGLKGALAEADIRAAGVDPDLRPERVSPADFARLANWQTVDHA
jgi:16S rRNA (adenine1518-N6/adenine1519-N6)-dimethyltransferase